MRCRGSTDQRSRGRWSPICLVRFLPPRWRPRRAAEGFGSIRARRPLAAFWGAVGLPGRADGAGGGSELDYRPVAPGARLSLRPVIASILIDAGCSLGSLLGEPNRAGGDCLPYLSAVALGRAWQEGRVYWPARSCSFTGEPPVTLPPRPGRGGRVPGGSAGGRGD